MHALISKNFRGDFILSEKNQNQWTLKLVDDLFNCAIYSLQHSSNLVQTSSNLAQNSTDTGTIWTAEHRTSKKTMEVLNRGDRQTDKVNN